MKNLVKVTLLAATILMSGQAAMASDAGATPVANDSAFKAFGGKPNIDALTVDFVKRISADPRIGKYFVNANLTRLTYELQQQFCYLLDGPCQYTGKDMKTTHASMGLHDADFNALAEDLQISMDTYHVPFRAQNVLVAKLAPMERAIVTK